MTLAVFEAPAMVQPRKFAITFDLKTWDFCIYENGSLVAELSADQGSALRDTILKTAGSSPNGEVPRG